MTAHTAHSQSADKSEKFARPLMRLETSYVMSGGELARGLFLAFIIGFGIATLCFLIFH